MSAPADVNTISPDILEAAKTYLSARKILIVDPNAASRVGIARALTDLGAKIGNIAMVAKYQEAVEYVKEALPSIIVTDFSLDGHSGLGLYKLMRDSSLDSWDGLFLLVTRNSSQSAVAEAAEEDIDAYILKPYALIQFRRLVAGAAAGKLRPSPYREKIGLGKKAMIEMQLEAAKAFFEAAIPLVEKPSLGYFYLGQCEFELQQLDNAEECFRKGLIYNQIHYKCLTGLCDTLTARKKLNEAYEIACTIAKHFPLNPNRLSQTLRLSVSTGHYDDVEEFYELFKEIETRSEELIKCVCAALVVTAKAHFKLGKLRKALQLVNNASVTAGGRTTILRGIVVLLVEQGRHDEAHGVLKRFSPQDQLGHDYRLAKLQHDIATNDDPRHIIHVARTAIQEGLNDPIAYESIAKNYVKINKPEEAREWAEKAVALWPELKFKFL